MIDPDEPGEGWAPVTAESLAEVTLQAVEGVGDALESAGVVISDALRARVLAKVEEKAAERMREVLDSIATRH